MIVLKRVKGEKAGAPTASPVASENRAWCHGQWTSPLTRTPSLRGAPKWVHLALKPQ
jgi:hypothetical protein